MKDTKIINLFAGPGCGKSTTAAGLFHEMKMRHMDVELVTEYAKDQVWEDRYNILDEQIYVFAHQYRRIARLRGKVEWVIVDSPIIMCCVYILPDYFKTLEPLVVETFNSFTNYNFMLNRTVEYIHHGRVQTEAQAIEKDQQILGVLQKYDVPHYNVDVNESVSKSILSHILPQ